MRCFNVSAKKFVLSGAERAVSPDERGKEETKMRNTLEWSFRLIATLAAIFAVRGFFLLVQNEKTKKITESFGKDVVELKYPRSVIIIGIIEIAFCCLPYPLSYFFPDTFKNLTDFTIIGFSIFALLGFVLIISATAEKITVIKSEDFFRERNFFGITKIIYYKFIENYRIYKERYLILRIKKPNGKIRKKIIDTSLVINIDILISIFPQKGVKRRYK